jgi:WXXGXW repeat (2 copies)
MKTKLLALVLLAGGSMFAQTRFSIGIHIGGNGRGYYPQTPPYASVQPPCPGPDYGWIDGYWSQNSGRSNWVPGYWTRQQYGRAYQTEPRYRQPSYDHRSYDAYSRQGSNRGFDRDGDRDDHEQGRAYGQDTRQSNAYANGFRNR